MRRRRFLAAALAGGLASAAGCSGGPGTGPSETDVRDGDGSPPGSETGTGSDAPPDRVGLETLTTALDAPVDLVFPSADRRYVADQSGAVFVHEGGGLRDEPLLDLRGDVEVGGEKGLLGLALHPEFTDARRLFVRYSAPSRSGTPSDYSHTFVLAEFAVSSDGRTARRDSEQTVLEIPEPQPNHNSGAVVFGPDDYLYVGVGDGGGGGDRGTGHADDWYGAVAGGNGQDVAENLLGSVLRLDVDGGGSSTPRTDDPYGVPDDNPLVGREGLDEQFAWGFRNPWRISFDGADLYAGDVGQSGYEEVDLVRGGGNYGWNVREGTHCYGADDCPEEAPVRGGEPLRDPVIQYPHDGDGVTGISIIGGHVYRGSALPGLEGTYLFGDLNAGGRLFAAAPDDGGGGGGERVGEDAGEVEGDGGGGGEQGGAGLWPIRVVEVADPAAGHLERLLSVGQDPAGEVYVLGVGAEGGGVHRVVPA